MLIGKFDDAHKGLFEVFEQDGDLVSKDEILGAHCKLLDVSDLRIELSPQLVRCQIVVLLDVEGFMEKELVYRSCMLLLCMAFLRLVIADKVVPEGVLLAHGVEVPHTSVDADDWLPLFLLSSMFRHRVTIAIVFTAILIVRCDLVELLLLLHLLMLRLLLIASKGLTPLVPVHKLAFLLLSD